MLPISSSQKKRIKTRDTDRAIPRLLDTQIFHSFANKSCMYIVGLNVR